MIATKSAVAPKRLDPVDIFFSCLIGTKQEFDENTECTHHASLDLSAAKRLQTKRVL